MCGIIIHGYRLQESSDWEGLQALQSNNFIELTHPGEILREDFLEPMGLGADELAKAIGLQQTRVWEIIRGQRDISAEISLLLDRFFGLSEGYWLRLQCD